MVKVLQDFKSFALKGNVVDLAVWVIIGTAFGKIVSSLVSDVAMPLLGILLGGVDFTKYAYVVTSVSGTDVTVKYGAFLQATFDFVVIAFSVFAFVSFLQKMQKPAKKAETAAPAKAEDVALLEEIRDLLKKSAKSK